MQLESFKHNFAKNLLAKWLRESAEEAICRIPETREYVSIPLQQLEHPPSPGVRTYQVPSMLRWRVNRGEPHYGVWTEYPIGHRGGHGPVWDETFIPCPKCTEENPCEYDRANDEEVKKHEARHYPFMEGPPSFDWYTGMFHEAPTVVFDVCIQHKGSVVTAIEVTNKHPVTPEKQARVQELGINLYEMSADWILAQVGRPDHLRVLTLTRDCW